MPLPPCAECGGDHPTGLCATRIAQRGVPEGKLPTREAPGARKGSLTLGDKVGNFTLTQVIGSGTTSHVFLADNEVSQAVAAVKALRPELHDDADMVRRFESEARTTNLVRHEHVVEIYDIGLHQGWQHYIQLELLEGTTLGTLLEEKLDPSWAVRIVLQLCSALGTAHSKGVTHRDLKPANVFVLERAGLPHAKLVDFGMARRELLERGEQRTRIGTIVGTAAYMSPEQTQGLEADGRSDIYSLGVLMFRMATGRLPFEAPTVIEAMTAQLTQDPPRPRTLNPEIPAAYEEVILHCLAKSPADRPQSMATVGRSVASAVGSDLLAPAPRGRTATAVFGTPAPPPPPRESPKPEADASLLPTPAEGNPAIRREPRVRTSFGVQVYTQLGALVGDAVVGDISLSGAFVRSTLALPLFSRVRLTGTSSAGAIDLVGEIVRLVVGDNAARGFGVRFEDLSPIQKAMLEALTAPRVVEDGEERDPHAEAELAMFESRMGGDSYQLLGLPKDASSRRIRDVCERLAEEMAVKHFPRLSPSQAARLVAITDRLTEAEEQLIDPTQRALNDAVNGNVLGVLRCITEGLSLEKVGALRAEFLKSRPDAERMAAPSISAAANYERLGDVPEALRSIADALCHDPLNLALHRKATELRGKRRGNVVTQPLAPGR